MRFFRNTNISSVALCWKFLFNIILRTAIEWVTQLERDKKNNFIYRISIAILALLLITSYFYCKKQQSHFDKFTKWNESHWDFSRSNGILLVSFLFHSNFEYKWTFGFYWNFKRQKPRKDMSNVWRVSTIQRDMYDLFQQMACQRLSIYVRRIHTRKRKKKWFTHFLFSFQNIILCGCGFVLFNI